MTCLELGAEEVAWVSPGRALSALPLHHPNPEKQGSSVTQGREREATLPAAEPGSSVQGGKQPRPSAGQHPCAKLPGSRASRQQAKQLPHSMNGSAGGCGADTLPRHFQQLAPSSPRRPRRGHLTCWGRATEGEPRQWEPRKEQCWEGESQFPQTRGPFFSGCTQILFREEESAWLWRL